MTEPNHTVDDLILPFQVADTAVRGRIVRLGGTIDDILSAHQFPDPLSELLGEAVSLVALMGASLKFGGKLIFQAQGNGPVSMVIADYSAGGALRGTAKASDDDLPRGARALLGDGSIALTIDQGPDMDRYQGVTPIEGERLADAAAAYFAQSEQIPTIVKLAVGRLSLPSKDDRWRAGGLMAQFVPHEGGTRDRGEAFTLSGDDQETWERARAFIETIQDDELLDPSISAETLLYRLFHEDGVRVFEPSPLRAACACNEEKVAAVLSRYAAEDLQDMVEDGAIAVTCEFCRKAYRFTPDGEPLGAQTQKAGNS